MKKYRNTKEWLCSLLGITVETEWKKCLRLLKRAEKDGR